jgi:hypothetical protein
MFGKKKKQEEELKKQGGGVKKEEEVVVDDEDEEEEEDEQEIGVEQLQQSPPAQQTQMRYFAIKPDSILRNEISLDALAEPYVLIHDERQKMGQIMYAANILARRKGYRINSFSVARFYAYLIVEKEKEQEKEEKEKHQAQKSETERSDNDDAPHKLQCLTN